MMPRVLRVVSSMVLLCAAVALAPRDAAAELKVSIGGYVKLDAEFQDEITTAGRFRIAPGPSNIVFDDGPGRDRARDHGQTLFDARQTRLRVGASDEFGDVRLRGLVEADFFGGSGNDDVSSTTSNPGVFRLRHAKAEAEVPLGPGRMTLLAGQWWSAFQNDEVTFPNLVDFNGPAGQLFGRQPQLRLTYAIPVGERRELRLIGDVEAQSVNFLDTGRSAPQFSFATANGTGGTSRQEGQTWPAITGKIQWMSDAFRAEVAGIGSRAAGFGADGARTSTFVYGLQGSVNVPIGMLTVHLHADALHGMNRLANADYPDAVFLGARRGVAAIDTVGAYAGLSYKLTKTTTFDAIYGLRAADPTGRSGFGHDVRAHTDEARQQSIHVNLLQQVYGRFQVGLEYERMSVEAFRTNSGAVNIYHVGVWFFF